MAVQNSTYRHDCCLLVSPTCRGKYIMRGSQGISLAMLIGTVIAALIICPDETSARIPPSWGRDQIEVPEQ
ncbi:hypothetical protein MTO96_045420 [Rhipicephalus appendiculatus]